MNDLAGFIKFIKSGFWLPESARFRQLFGDCCKQELIHACKTTDTSRLQALVFSIPDPNERTNMMQRICEQFGMLIKPTNGLLCFESKEVRMRLKNNHRAMLSCYNLLLGFKNPPEIGLIKLERQDLTINECVDHFLDLLVLNRRQVTADHLNAIEQMLQTLRSRLAEQNPQPERME